MRESQQWGSILKRGDKSCSENSTSILFVKYSILVVVDPQTLQVKPHDHGEIRRSKAISGLWKGVFKRLRDKLFVAHTMSTTLWLRPKIPAAFPNTDLRYYFYSWYIFTSFLITLSIMERQLWTTIKRFFPNSFHTNSLMSVLKASYIYWLRSLKYHK